MNVIACMLYYLSILAPLGLLPTAVIGLMLVEYRARRARRVEIIRHAPTGQVDGRAIAV
jgi:hypothetical protein